MDFTKQISCTSAYSSNGLDKLTRHNKQVKKYRKINYYNMDDYYFHIYSIIRIDS